MEVAPGLIGEVEIVVQPPDTADAHGNKGVHVLATPRLVALFEEAAIQAVQSHLPPGGGTVGTRLEVKHLAATRMGVSSGSREFHTGDCPVHHTGEGQRRDGHVAGRSPV